MEVLRGLSDDEYNYSDKYKEFWRATTLKDAGEGYKHFAKMVKNPTQYTDVQLATFSIGHFIEAYLCNDKEKLSEFCVYDTANRPNKGMTMAAKENKSWKADLVAKFGNNLIEAKDVAFIYDLLLFDEEKELIDKIKDKDSTQQLSLFWTDKETGLSLKTRPDVVREQSRWIWDIKTTKAKTEHEFKRDIKKLNYSIQAQMQIDGCKKCGIIEDLNGYLWIGISKAHPHNVFFVKYSAESMQRDYTKYREALRMAKRYEDHGLTGLDGGELLGEY